MPLYRRVPHVCEAEPSAFLTWRLRDSVPSRQTFPMEAHDSGLAFAATDRLLDRARHGSLYLRQPAAADMVVEAEKSYVRMVRYEAEFEEIRNYIEENPVRAGLVREVGEYPWSSAGRMARGLIRGIPQVGSVGQELSPAGQTPFV